MNAAHIYIYTHAKALISYLKHAGAKLCNQQDSDSSTRMGRSPSNRTELKATHGR